MKDTIIDAIRHQLTIKAVEKFDDTLDKNAEKVCYDGRELVIRAPKLLIGVGLIDILFTFILCRQLYLQLLVEGAQKLGFLWIVLLGGLFLFLGVALVLFSLPGFYEIRMQENRICIRKYFFSKRELTLSQIQLCYLKKAQIDVFVKGETKRAFHVNTKNSSANVFLRRLVEENIPFYEKIKKEDYPVTYNGRNFIYVEEQLRQEQKIRLAEMNPTFRVAKREIEE